MKATMSTVRELLIDLEISDQFQKSHLESLFDLSFFSSVNDVIDVIGTAIAVFEHHLDDSQRRQLTPEEVYSYHRLGISDEGKVPFPRSFTVRSKVRRNLVSVFQVDDVFVIEQMGNFISETRAEIKKTGRMPREYNWERIFVEYFLTAIGLQEEQLDSLHTASNREKPANNEGLKKLDAISQQLTRNFSLGKRHKGYPEDWYPSPRVFAFLNSFGLPGNYISNLGIIASFRIECRRQKIPRYKAEHAYVKFLERNSNVLEALSKR